MCLKVRTLHHLKYINGLYFDCEERWKEKEMRERKSNIKKERNRKRARKKEKTKIKQRERENTDLKNHFGRFLKEKKTRYFIKS